MDSVEGEFRPSETVIEYSSMKLSLMADFWSIRRYGPFSVVTGGHSGTSEAAVGFLKHRNS